MAPSQTPEVLQLSSSVRRHGMLALPSTKHLHWRWTCEEYMGKSSSGWHLPLWTLHPALLFPYLLSGLCRRAAWALLHKVFPLDMSGAGLLLYQRAARLTLQASILSKTHWNQTAFTQTTFTRQNKMLNPLIFVNSHHSIPIKISTQAKALRCHTVTLGNTNPSVLLIPWH